MTLSLERKRGLGGGPTNGFSLNILKNNVELNHTMETEAMKTTTLATCFIVALTPAALAMAVADPPFFGVWSCTMMNDGNMINVADWWQERFDEKGVLPEGAEKPTKLSMRRLTSAHYELTYADGAKARIEMMKPWIFLRHTAEHRYLCLSKSPK